MDSIRRGDKDLHLPISSLYTLECDGDRCFNDTELSRADGFGD